MLALRDEEGRLRILVHRELRNMYGGDDLEYLDSLMWDFVERAKVRPDDLIEQLSSLGDVGPLIINELGGDISLSSICRDKGKEFVEL